jgi:hypothetical protein
VAEEISKHVIAAFFTSVTALEWTLGKGDILFEGQSV